MTVVDARDRADGADYDKAPFIEQDRRRGSSTHACLTTSIPRRNPSLAEAVCAMGDRAALRHSASPGDRTSASRRGASDGGRKLFMRAHGSREPVSATSGLPVLRLPAQSRVPAT